MTVTTAKINIIKLQRLDDSVPSSIMDSREGFIENLKIQVCFIGCFRVCNMKIGSYFKNTNVRLPALSVKDLNERVAGNAFEEESYFTLIKVW